MGGILFLKCRAFSTLLIETKQRPPTALPVSSVVQAGQCPVSAVLRLLMWRVQEETRNGKGLKAAF